MKREIEAKKHSNAVKEKDLQIIFLQKTINDLESKLLSFQKKKRKKLLLKLQLN
jgi:vacuolar-type H+-ATPase subunit F/Vma7